MKVDGYIKILFAKVMVRTCQRHKRRLYKTATGLHNTATGLHRRSAVRESFPSLLQSSALVTKVWSRPPFRNLSCTGKQHNSPSQGRSWVHLTSENYLTNLKVNYREPGFKRIIKVILAMHTSVSSASVVAPNPFSKQKMTDFNT